MKILIVNTSDIEGGAARAAHRLHRALLNEGTNSQVLVQNKTSDDFTVIGPATKIQKGLAKIRSALDTWPTHSYKQRTQTPFSPSWIPFGNNVDRINAINPDIVHLHWVTGGMMRIEDIARIKAPVVWSLHDMWPFTGGCHYDEECAGYKKSCGKCKVLGSSKFNDLSKKVYLRKQQTFAKKKDITIVGLSRWLAGEASSSSLFEGYSVVNLPNPINTQTFSPFDKTQARILLNLPQDKKIILFGAMGATSDLRKGFNELSQALQLIQSQEVVLAVFGASQPKKDTSFKQKAHYLGILHDDVALRVLYSAADVMVVPSLQENLSNTIMESLACGTPVVCFSIGGNSDLIDHKINGYLAKPFSPYDLAQGIDWVLQNENPKFYANNARQKVVNNFGEKIVAKQYINLYRDILKKEK
ncbi:MAG: glycosyltransferase family 4 protein [Bacteriovoracaceae bacterium]|nr:glycosyltransferase family 4 protein [Bacteriovoracaceae bacterium]